MEKTEKTNSLEEVKKVENQKISYEDFAKVEIKVGEIKSAEKIPDTDKLLKLIVDFAEPSGPRQIVSGISMYYPDPALLVGKKAMFVTNLEPRKLRGLVSDGMLFALSTDTGDFSLVVPEKEMPVGIKAK